ncbi:allantoicase [Phlegmacium glaucopus]|nr:allantoicase [Phlegmacium glaucopus]
MSFERIALNDFNEKFSSLTELSSVALGGRIVAISDEFFAEAFHLLLVEPAPSMKGQFGPNGALFSGWETRRHNPTYDWCIIQLGTTGTISGFDIDTANFNGNEAPEASVYALYDAELRDPLHDDPRWSEIMPRVGLGPSSHHLFKVPTTPAFNYVKIHMYPDGGIARFRTYGQVTPVHPSDNNSVFDLAHVFAGGRVLDVSDQHFGVGSNLILPGRGKNMGDGWETKRSRTKGHNDWVVIQLGAPGFLEQVEIDTKHFLGNFPESCEIHALYTEHNINWQTAVLEEQGWTSILARTKLGPDRQHYFELENVKSNVYTHVKVTIYPDGGIKRVRFLGRKAERPWDVSNKEPSDSHQSIFASSMTSAPSDFLKMIILPVVPLESGAFSPFGQVIQAYKNLPNGIQVTPANAGTANKFHKLSLLEAFYPSDAGATAGISVYRCQPLEDIVDGTIVLKTLERHPYTNQVFIPMGSGDGEGLDDPGCSYLVVVAHNGSDDRPDTQTLKAFLASSAQGIAYNPGVWHQPMTVIEKPLDLACVETQIGGGNPMDCEIVELDSTCKILLKLNT